jgi:DNA-3-methyladenine glycosylase
MGTRSWTGGRSSDRGRRLGRSFFDRPAVRVARELLGARLIVGSGTSVREARLVETEAYLRGDPASHAFRGPTRRNRSMFLGPGTVYVFRIHQVVCANLVCRAGEAVLLRAGEVVGGPRHAGRGPGRLARALGITIADDGSDAVVGPRFRLRPGPADRIAVALGPRIGIRLAADRPLRFWIRGDPEVSRGRAPSGAAASPSRTRGAAPSRRSRTRSRPAFAGGRSGGRTGGR